MKWIFYTKKFMKRKATFEEILDDLETITIKFIIEYNTY